MEMELEISHAVELLIKWNFSEEVQLAFLNAGIEMKQFLSMGLLQLREFVPDETERLRLIRCILQYKLAKQPPSSVSDRHDSESLPGSNSDLEVDQYLNSGNNKSSTESTPPSSQPTSNAPSGSRAGSVPDQRATISAQNKFDELVSDRHDSESLPGSNPDLEVDQYLNSGNNKSSTESTPPSSEPTSNAPSGSRASSVPDRLATILARNKFKELDLEAYLKEDVESAVVLLNNPNGVLSREKRKTLVKFLATLLMKDNYSPTTGDFLIIREKIQALFPNEPKDLYYVAPKESGVSQVLAKGKLFDKVRNRTSKLIKLGAIAPRRRKRSTLEESTSLSEQPRPTTSPELDGATVLLKRARDWTPEVEEQWKITSANRLETLRKRSANTEQRRRRQRVGKKKTNDTEDKEGDLVFDYFDEYKVLKSPSGYKLLVLDFKQLYPTEYNNLFLQWPEISMSLEKLALKSKFQDHDSKYMLKRLSHTQSSKEGEEDSEEFNNNSEEEFPPLDDENRDAVLLQLLPSLCPPTARVTVGKKSMKPSVIESRDAFICHTTVAADLEPLMERRRQRMSKLKGPLQPYVILLGPQRSNITASYVAVDRVLYKVESTLHAVDTCFKLFHALWCGYPAEANHLWHFFHLYIYKVKHDVATDGCVPNSTLDFIATMETC